jgi:hypothetical protein
MISRFPPWLAGVLTVAGLFIIVNLIVASLTLPVPSRVEPHPRSTNSAIDPSSIPVTPQGLAGEIDSGSLTGPSLISLEMRENVDFLFTPALIVQGCITEGSIVTYPEE